MKTKKMVLTALLIAVNVVLGYFSISLGNMVITLSGLPILLAGFLFGPVAGFEVGLIGSFLSQLLRYGLMPTTILWIIPGAVRGFMVGYYALKRGFKLNFRQMTFITIISAFVVTLLNTLGMYIDSKVYGYYTFAYVFGMLLFRILSAILTSAAYLVIIPTLMKYLNIFKTEGGSLPD